jgi:hypothetical protein
MSVEKTYWSADKKTCLDRVMHEYEQAEIGLTVRHYYYTLLSTGALKKMDIPNSGQNAYKFVSRLLTEVREEGELPWEAVSDPGRRRHTHRAYDSLTGYVEYESQSGFLLDAWRGQQYRLEVWIEKDAMADYAIRIVNDYRVPVYVAKGFVSTTVKKEAAERYGSGENWIVLYCGDFDPSGVDIERSLREGLAEYGSCPRIIRVALTQEIANQLPSDAALELNWNDKRTKRFVELYGTDQKGYELDAITLEMFRNALLGAVHQYMDVDKYNAALRLEEIIQAEASERLKTAMSDFSNSILAYGVPESTMPLSEQLVYLQ